MINKMTPSVDQNHWLKCLDTTSLDPTNKIFTNVPKVFQPWNKIKSL